MTVLWEIIMLREKNKKEIMERERAETEANSLRRKVLFQYRYRWLIKFEINMLSN